MATPITHDNKLESNQNAYVNAVTYVLHVWITEYTSIYTSFAVDFSRNECAAIFKRSYFIICLS